MMPTNKQIFWGMLCSCFIGVGATAIIHYSILKSEINRILNEPLIVESVTRYVERIDDNFSEEVFIWTVCNVKCYELKRKHNIAIGSELEVKR